MTAEHRNTRLPQIVKASSVVLAVLLLSTALATIMRHRRDLPSEGKRYLDATVLDDTLRPLIEEFNRRHDRPRLLAVLSPSCPVCLAGVESLAEGLDGGALNADLLLVWMEVLPADIKGSHGRRVELLADRPRAAQFIDSRQLSGKEVGRLLDWPGHQPAWDVYLLFPAGATWQEAPPPPAAWFHQWQDVDPARYRTADQLTPSLALALERLLAASSPSITP